MRRAYIHQWTRYGVSIALCTVVFFVWSMYPSYAQTQSSSMETAPQPTLTIKQRKQFTKDFVKDGQVLGTSVRIRNDNKDTSSTKNANLNQKPMGTPPSAQNKTPTAVPTATPTKTLPPTTHPTQSLEPTSAEPPPKPPSLDQDRLFDMVNEHRESLGIYRYERSEELCTIARTRGPELYDEIFVTGNIHGGFYQREKDIPYWVTENMKHGGSLEEVLNWWLSSNLHSTAIESDQHTHACTECYGNTCIMLFTSFIAK